MLPVPSFNEKELRTLKRAGLSPRQISVLTGLRLPNVSDEVDYKIYLQYVQRMTSRVAKAYGIKHTGLYMSPLEAFKSEQPLPLSIICHPANLATAKKWKALKISKLKQRIKAWETKKGAVVFPAEYMLEFKKQQISHASNELRVVAFDPGSSNFGCFGGVLKLTKGKLSGMELLISKMLKNPIKTLGPDFPRQAEAYRSEIIEILLSVKPQVIVIERFQSRGLKGTTIELVNVMIGILSEIVHKIQQEYGLTIELKTPTASLWKNALNRQFSLESMYEHLPGSQLHRLDACLMSVYALLSSDKDAYAWFTETRRMGLVEFIKETRA